MTDGHESNDAPLALDGVDDAKAADAILPLRRAAHTIRGDTVVAAGPGGATDRMLAGAAVVVVLRTQTLWRTAVQGAVRV